LQLLIFWFRAPDETAVLLQPYKQMLNEPILRQDGAENQWKKFPHTICFQRHGSVTVSLTFIERHHLARAPSLEIKLPLSPLSLVRINRHSLRIYIPSDFGYGTPFFLLSRVVGVECSYFFRLANSWGLLHCD
jgi:hypothetical protein